MGVRRRTLAGAAGVTVLAAAAMAALGGNPSNRPAPAKGPDLRTITTSYYVMHTDVSDEMAREAQLRMDRMFEEYATRTASFSRPPRDRFPFFLFTQREDYIAAGGPPKSGGVFLGAAMGNQVAGQLMTFVKGQDRTWHVVQHEGFHQFAFTSISRDLPVWANEGLAEYFGEGLFTGDAMVTGLIPEARRQEVVDMIQDGRYVPLGQFVNISDEEWGANIKHSNYTQAWSMTHFLAHGDNGKYQKAFSAYMGMLTKGVDPKRAWQAQFGVGTGDATFEAAWRKWWLALPERPTAQLYAQARVMVLASFLSRATDANKKRYESMAAFLDDAREEKVALPKDGPKWLPPSLLASAVAARGLDPADFTIRWQGSTPLVTLKFEESIIAVEFRNGHTVATVKDAPKPKTKPTTRGASTSPSPTAPPAGTSRG